MEIIIRASLDGFPFEIHLSPHEMVNNSELPPLGAYKVLVDMLREEGMTPPRVVGAVSNEKPQGSLEQAQPPQAQRPARQAPLPQQAQGGWVCPVHGAKSIGPGYQGRGVECKVWTANPEVDDPNYQWVQLDSEFQPIPRRLNNGSVRYYCRFKDMRRA